MSENLDSNEIITTFASLKDDKELSLVSNPKRLTMTDEQFEKEVKDLTENLRNLRLIKDKGRTKWLRAFIRDQLNRLLKD